jgi:hypothetical protein
MAKKTQNEIRNKMVRNSMFIKQKQEKLKEKKKAKKENKNKPKQIPKTIENCRIKDETYIGNIQDDEELQLDLRTDEISKHLLKTKSNDEKIDEKNGENDDFSKEDEKQYNQEESNENEDETQLDEEDATENEEENTDPKILITTTELRISLKTFKLCKELSRVLPNAQYFFRKNVRITKVIPEAIKRKYSAMIVINENNKVPSKISI